LIIVLDTGILGGITNPISRSATVKAMTAWAADMRAAGHVFAIPAIADYEVRRELLRGRYADSVAALDTFCTLAANLYLSLTDTALHRAAELWAEVRNEGRPTAKDAALDGDVILMAQVFEAGFAPGSFIVATDNLKHFTGRIPADEWRKITP
jgi:hypothetical protein